MNYFTYSRELVESFSIVSIFLNSNGTLIEDNHYSVYMMNNYDTFTILDESNQLKKHNMELFIRGDVYTKYKEIGTLDNNNDNQ